jgi:hypothetical protein
MTEFTERLTTALADRYRIVVAVSDWFEELRARVPADR